MWAAFRTGSAGRRWAGRCGHRLTAHNIGRVSRRQAASTPDTRHLQSPRIRLCWSLPLRTAPHSDIESACAYGYGSLSTALQERIRLAPLQSGIGSTSCADTRLAVTMPAQCSVNACPATPNGSPAHTQCSNRLVAPLPLSASPVLSLRSEVVGGVSLPEVLHFAHRTLCFSPPIEHTPTSPKSTETNTLVQIRYCVAFC